MTTNPRSEAAAKHLANAASEPKHIYSSEAEMAQANATLAVAFEQRTANLLAYLLLVEEFRHAGGTPEVRDFDAKIRARLGLTTAEVSR